VGIGCALDIGLDVVFVTSLAFVLLPATFMCLAIVI
jgi:hypothetical protein